MSDRITKNLVGKSLFRAAAAKRPEKGLYTIQIEAVSTAPTITGSC